MSLLKRTKKAKNRLKNGRVKTGGDNVLRREGFAAKIGPSGRRQQGPGAFSNKVPPLYIVVEDSIPIKWASRQNTKIFVAVVFMVFSPVIPKQMTYLLSVSEEELPRPPLERFRRWDLRIAAVRATGAGFNIVTDK